MFRRILDPVLPRLTRHGSLEHVAMRLLFAGTVVYAISWGLPYRDQPFPNGLAHWLDLTFIGDWTYLRPLMWLTVVSLGFFVVGWFPALALVVPLGVAVCVGTVINSQGAINHDSQMVVMAGLAQLAVLVAAAFAPGRRARSWWRPERVWFDRSAQAARLAIAASYMVSACVKLDESDGRWIHDVPKLAVQIQKTNQSNFSNDLVPPDPFRGEAVPRWIVDHPWQARAVFGAGLALELAFFLGLAGRRWALAIGLATISLHTAVWWLMGLDFSTNILLLATFFVLPGLWPSRPEASGEEADARPSPTPQPG